MEAGNVSRVQQHFDRHSAEYTDKYFKSSIELYRKENDFLKKYMRYQPTTALNVLDLGAGRGLWGDLLLEEYTQARVTCADLSLVMLQTNQVLPRKQLVIADATKPPFQEASFDLISISALMHHLIDYKGYYPTIRNITKFLSSVKTLLKPGGHIIVREIYHESVLQEHLVSRLLFHVSTAQLPVAISSVVRAVGVRSQGGGACFLTRKQWASVVAQSGYTLVGQQAVGWKVPRIRRLAGIQSSGDLFLLLR